MKQSKMNATDRGFMKLENVMARCKTTAKTAATLTTQSEA